MRINHNKHFRALIQSASVVFLTVVASGASKAQPAESAPAPSLGLWRSVTLSQGFTYQDYSEPDPLGRVNPLDSETGSIPTTQVTLRWRGQLLEALPELLLQAHASYAQGQTDYSGYLQQGGSLTPYAANTGNTMQTLRLRVGLPLNALTQQPWAKHIAPYAEQSWHQWQRNLTQYGEAFDWQTSSLGVIGIWTLADLGVPQLARFTLEADVAVGRTRRPSMSAPALDFAADLGETDSHSAALSLQYAVTPRWSLGLKYTTQRTSIGASARSGGLQFPGANYNSQGWFVSVGAQL